MLKLHEQNVSDKQFAQRMSLMIDSGLITYKHYYHWTDEIIAVMDEPPYWVLELSCIKYKREAIRVVNEFVASEPFEFFDSEIYCDEHIACLFLRYEREEIAWATFLNEAGKFTDAMNGHHHCEDFYSPLNDLEESEFSKDVEHKQRTEIEAEYAQAIAPIRELYNGFREHFKLHLANKTNQKAS